MLILHTIKDTHGVCFAGAGLAVRKHGAVVAGEDVLHDGPANFVVHILL